MAKFEYTLSEDDKDRAYVRADDAFDINSLRTEEELIIDVYDSDNDEIDLLGTLAILEDSLARYGEE
jgi:hypothetical protein